MKTYHEMTESVLQKAGAEILKKERRRRNLVCVTASGLCLAPSAAAPDIVPMR